MSIYALGSDAWEVILGYLDASDTLRLLSSGDHTLRCILKPAIRDFVVTIETKTSPRLSSLLNLFKGSSTHPHRFSISLGQWHEKLRLVTEDYTAEKWKTFFPETLETLELTLDCSHPPFSSLLASLATLAPNLKRLHTYGVPEIVVWPKHVVSLEFGASIDAGYAQKVIVSSSFISTLPTTLTHLKFNQNILLECEIYVSALPFRNMPLTVFHGHIRFISLSHDKACWSILPNTIECLRAKLFYGIIGRQLFEPPKNLSWKHHFPNLKSLNVPLRSLADQDLILDSANKDIEPLSEEQMESIRNSFPASLTALKIFPFDNAAVIYDVPRIICAIGPQLVSYEYESLLANAETLKWLPKWKNPRIRIFKGTDSEVSWRDAILGGQNFENFCEKKHPISLLCRNAASLTTGLLPASAISFLPRTITSLQLVLAEKEPLSLESALEASQRLNLLSSDISIDDKVDTKDFKVDMRLGWANFLDWPKNLTDLSLRLDGPTTIHLGCLPETLTNLNVSAYSGSKPFKFEGGDLSHISKLSCFRLSMESPTLITSLKCLPRSIRSLQLFYNSIAEDVLAHPDLEIFFFNLQVLQLKFYDYSANVLLYLPKTLKSCEIIFTSTSGASLCEKHFEKISRTNLANLSLTGDAKWPEHLGFDVFSRFMPPTLASLTLLLEDFCNKGVEEEIASHIPNTLLIFNSYGMIQRAYDNRIKYSGL